jgi:hypothetical protein
VRPVSPGPPVRSTNATSTRPVSPAPVRTRPVSPGPAAAAAAAAAHTAASRSQNRPSSPTRTPTARHQSSVSPTRGRSPAASTTTTITYNPITSSSAASRPKSPTRAVSPSRAKSPGPWQYSSRQQYNTGQQYSPGQLRSPEPSSGAGSSYAMHSYALDSLQSRLCSSPADTPAAALLRQPPVAFAAVGGPGGSSKSSSSSRVHRMSAHCSPGVSPRELTPSPSTASGAAAAMLAQVFLHLLVVCCFDFRRVTFFACQLQHNPLHQAQQLPC